MGRVRSIAHGWLWGGRVSRARGGEDKDARWVDVHEGEYDEAQMAEWVRQAAALPGWDGF